MDEHGVHPLQIHWLKACVTFFRAACARQHGKPLFYRAMSANVILSRHSDVAWCVKLAVFLVVIGVEGSNGTCIGHMDMGHPPGIACSVRCMISWAMDIGQNCIMLRCRLLMFDIFERRLWGKKQTCMAIF
jgi:hypothetical protein